MVLQAALPEDEHFGVDFFRESIREVACKEEEKMEKAKLTGVKKMNLAWLV